MKNTKHSLVRAASLLGSLLSLTPLHAADQIVGPGGHASFAAAVAAAQPGDRIVLRQNAVRVGFTPITIPLTIESEVGMGPFNLWTADNFGPSPTWSISAPVTLRRVNVVLTDADNYQFNLGVTNGVEIRAGGGRVVFDRVTAEVRVVSGIMRRMFDIEAGELLMRQTEIAAPDTGSTAGYVYDAGGISCLRSSASKLFLEDCELTAGSGPIVFDFANSRLLPGGTALVSSALTSAMVRTTLSDGNGGINWTGISQVLGTSPPGQSIYGGSFYEVTAVPGAVRLTYSQVPRGAPIAIGDRQAPLRSDGGKMGRPLTFTLAPPVAPEFTALGISLGFGFQARPRTFLGASFVDNIYFAPSIGPLIVPPSPSLIGLIVVTQPVLLQPPRWGNPSFVELHL